MLEGFLSFCGIYSSPRKRLVGWVGIGFIGYIFQSLSVSFIVGWLWLGNSAGLWTSLFIGPIDPVRWRCQLQPEDTSDAERCGSGLAVVVTLISQQMVGGSGRDGDRQRRRGR